MSEVLGLLDCVRKQSGKASSLLLCAWRQMGEHSVRIKCHFSMFGTNATKPRKNSWVLHHFGEIKRTNLHCLVGHWYLEWSLKILECPLT